MEKKYPTYEKFNLPEIEKEILAFWKREDIFWSSIKERDKNQSFTFYEGPPSANGAPGIHHVMARTIKDIFCRYKTLQGYRVNRKAGWDTHGLPVELAVEKALKITKEDIGKKISVEEYNQKCLQQVSTYTKEWNMLTEKIGYWVDLEKPYITYTKEYIESLWWILKQLHGKGALYKGYSVQPFSPKAGSALSSHELNQPGCYRDVKDTSITAQFKVKKSKESEFLFKAEEEEIFVLAWTTTPWTLPSNCALAVGENIDYVKIKTFNPYTEKPVSIVLAKDLIGKVLKENKFKKVQEEQELVFDSQSKTIPFWLDSDLSSFKGTELLGIRYEQLLPYVCNSTLEQNAFKIISGDFVSTEDGTGVVHTASVFGADDFRVCQANQIPSVLVKDENGKEIPLVDRQGRFVKEVSDFAYRYVKEEYYSEEERKNPDFKPTDVLIAIKLKEENKAFWVEKYEHSYPFCWRTDAPVLYYPIESWFIKTTAYKDRLIELNNTIQWKPASTGTGRFGNWLENLVDWNISRSRFWGTPLPIWRTEDFSEEVCIGSYEELEQKAKQSLDKGFISNDLYQKIKTKELDLHKPFVDEIVLVSESGKKMYRENDLVDVWFDSGSMPYAQWHYPFENKEEFDKNYPADFISEGVDQTRGWFFTLHAIAVLLKDSISFKNVVSTGLVLDEEGEKMSKRKGNVVDPFQAIDKYGADAIRLYMISNASPWENLKFSFAGLEEVKRKFFGTLYNTYAFFALYANIDKFDYKTADVPFEQRPEIDRWILSSLNSLVKTVEKAYETYEPTVAARGIINFLDVHLSNWYVRLSRRRFWKNDSLEESDKLSAFQTLYTCLETIAKLISPIAPFYSDKLYRDLNMITQKENHKSVHLSLFPKCREDYIDLALEERMDYAQKICSLALSIRKKQNINVRQPLKTILIPVLNKDFQSKIELVQDLILNEINVKELVFVDSDSDIIVKKAKANFKTLGPKYGKEVSKYVQAIQQLDKTQIFELEEKGELKISSLENKITLEDVEIMAENVEGWQISSAGKITIALDLHITEELATEGIARELINRIQNLRKDKNFDVTDRIQIGIEKTDYLTLAIEKQKAYICNETLATDIFFIDKSEGESLEIHDNPFKIKLVRNK